jgi:Zn-dependent protease
MGTTIWLRPSFLILMALFVFLDLDSQVKIAHALLWIPVLLVSVLVHELAHAATIAAFGYGPSTIELGGWGGQTSNARRSKPWHEVVVSVAGPVSSLLLGGCFLVIFIAAHEQFTPEVFVFVRLMLWANIAWGIFNMLPIFPLDGGQVLFNSLCHFTASQKALGVTTVLSIVLALTLGLGALWARQFFVAVIAASLVMQNWQTWKSLRDYRSKLTDREDPSSSRDNLASSQGD